MIMKNATGDKEVEVHGVPITYSHNTILTQIYRNYEMHIFVNIKVEIMCSLIFVFGRTKMEQKLVNFLLIIGT